MQKELKEIKLCGDTLKDLEIFWDAVLGAFTNLCQVNQAYPYYRDLKPDFTFKKHLVDPIKPPRYLPIECDQVQRNYRSFGDALRIFLQSGTTIVESTSPKTYLQLLSLCDTRDGFLLLSTLVFSLSPQLSGDYHDYRQDIDTLSIIPGEHLSKFYQRVIQLSNEIILSNIQNGNLALLAYRFISLLRSTKCTTIIGLINPYWKTITKHRRDPNHLIAPLPWKFKEVYDDLICSDILYLPNIPSPNSEHTVLPFAARGTSNISTTISKVLHRLMSRMQNLRLLVFIVLRMVDVLLVTITNFCLLNNLCASFARISTPTLGMLQRIARTNTRHTSSLKTYERKLCNITHYTGRKIITTTKIKTYLLQPIHQGKLQDIVQQH